MKTKNQQIAEILGKCVCEEPYVVKGDICTKCGAPARANYTADPDTAFAAFRERFPYFLIANFVGGCSITGYPGENNIPVTGIGKDYGEACVNAILNSAK